MSGVRVPSPAQKRLASWECSSNCLLLKNGEKVVDVDKHTHLTSPRRRGIHITTDKTMSEQEALDASEQLMVNVCNGVETYEGARIEWLGKDCSLNKICNPQKAAVKADNNSWRPAVRPYHQRP